MMLFIALSIFCERSCSLYLAGYVSGRLARMSAGANSKRIQYSSVPKLDFRPALYSRKSSPHVAKVRQLESPL